MIDRTWRVRTRGVDPAVPTVVQPDEELGQDGAMALDLGLVYLQHLTGHDRQLLAEAGVSETGPVVDLLGEARTQDVVFGPRRAGEPLLQPSPFLTFAVAVHRAAAELSVATFTEEWVGPRRRVAVFDVDVLRAFVGDPLRRLFLIELLASYTHVARRFDDLDPVRLAGMLEVVAEEERPGVYRRLGDLALFLTGVFPDHTAAHGLAPVGRNGLLRSGQAGDDANESDGDLPAALDRLGAVGTLELLGRRWYQLAASTVPGPPTSTMQAVDDVAQHFRTARRILNYVTEQFLFPSRTQWFGV